MSEEEINPYYRSYVRKDGKIVVEKLNTELVDYVLDLVKKNKDKEFRNDQ